LAVFLSPVPHETRTRRRSARGTHPVEISVLERAHRLATETYVLKVGPRYAVANNIRIGEWSGVHWVFDTAFVYKGPYLY